MLKKFISNLFDTIAKFRSQFWLALTNLQARSYFQTAIRELIYKTTETINNLRFQVKKQIYEVRANWRGSLRDIQIPERVNSFLYQWVIDIGPFLMVGWLVWAYGNADMSRYWLGIVMVSAFPYTIVNHVLYLYNKYGWLGRSIWLIGFVIFIYYNLVSNICR